MAFDSNQSRDEPDWTRPVFGPVSWRSILERRSTIWNDDGIVGPAVPDNFQTGVDDYGKFFPRGCRGTINRIQMYCIRTGVGTITLRYSAHPGIGPFGEVTITPAGVWAWQTAFMRQMWNYDSLFIWVHECDADVSWAFDRELPYDGHITTDGWATHYPVLWRPFIRVECAGETPGDVPVSGTVNVVEIPSVATSTATVDAVNVPHNILTPIIEIEGAGTMVRAELRFRTSTVPAAGPRPGAASYVIALYVDGVLSWAADNRQICQSDVATFGRCSMGEFHIEDVADPAYHRTFLDVRIPLKFRRSLYLYALQSTGVAVDTDGEIVTNLIS